MTIDSNGHSNPHTILIASGGAGASGEQVVYTVLAQFPNSRVKVVTVPHLRTAYQLNRLMEQAAAERCTLVHTMVDGELRQQLIEQAASLGVVAIDLMGPLFDRLESILGETPLGEPGLYRLLNKAYFERVESIEFGMSHDDGRHPEGWPEAEIVLVGASRVGKTPLSLYLSVLGWKVANVPIVPELSPPEGLTWLDPRRVIGLDIAPAQLLTFRTERQKRLGVPGPSEYTDPQRIFEELELVKAMCKRAGFSLLDVTDRPIESSADEVIRMITNRYGSRPRQA